MTDRSEIIRRQRVGNIRSYLRHRYGHTLPEGDDAARDDLFELLLAVSLRATSPARVMANTIEIWAPWMPAADRAELLQQVELIPPRQRRRTAKDLGKRFNLTNAEREQLKAWTIHPANMSDADMAEWRKAKRRHRDMKARRRNGRVMRTIYRAKSVSRRRPWVSEGISRPTWYRRQKLLRQGVRQVCVKQTLTGERTLVSSELVESQKESAGQRVLGKGTERNVKGSVH